MEEVRWDRLKRGQRFLCPRDGQPESFLRRWTYVRGEIMVRTSRHDHRVFPSATVEVVAPRKA